MSPVWDLTKPEGLIILVYATNDEYMKRLTNRQEQVLGFVQSYARVRGYPPTIREIASHFGFGPRAAKEHLDLIEKKGFIKRGREARSIEILTQARLRFDGIPIVGKVAAGSPIFAEENVEGFLKVDGYIANGEEVFFLRVRGDSMQDSGIRNGDYVLVKKQSVANNGEFVVARINDEATVKEFKKNRGRIELIPHNPEYEIIELTPEEDFEILGKVIGLWRRM